MAGVTDRAMRQLCAEFGADFVVSEMISAKAVCYGDKKSLEIADITNDKVSCAIQIFGSEPNIMAKGAKILYDEYKPSSIDINMGCPVHKICSNGEGSALMKEPKKACEIVNAVKKSIECPVSVKFRAGWDENSKNAPEFAKLMENAGADFLFIHGRTKAQMYNPPVDFDVIAQVKNSVSIPVIGNGSIYSYDDAENMMLDTNCDGLGIARGAWGAPWIFEEIKAKAAGKHYTPPTNNKKIDIAIRHLKLLIEYKGEYTGIHEARKHLSKYLYGMHGACEARVEINKCENADKMIKILENLVK